MLGFMRGIKGSGKDRAQSTLWGRVPPVTPEALNQQWGHVRAFSQPGHNFTYTHTHTQRKKKN